MFVEGVEATVYVDARDGVVAGENVCEVAGHLHLVVVGLFEVNHVDVVALGGLVEAHVAVAAAEVEDGAAGGGFVEGEAGGGEEFVE